ncbi:hypothetical protein J5N97_003807 [Dioscorea zingiberensis]|uniref:Uncharacterized protein n=1 Tax=Dioscorea zingiberensis TaxID=325984 RepID=A0A9D5D5B0_9LILI|nr:hypothetical protein J5N97_003807 [Dioscorea zingiberensis]
MCPLRLVLIFLSATLAGFFVLKGLKAQPEDLTPQDKDWEKNNSSLALEDPPLSLLSKVWLVISSVFWTCMDMASGRYLWRNLTVSSSTMSSDKKL